MRFIKESQDFDKTNALITMINNIANSSGSVSQKIQKLDRIRKENSGNDAVQDRCNKILTKLYDVRYDGKRAPEQRDTIKKGELDLDEALGLKENRTKKLAQLKASQQPFFTQSEKFYQDLVGKTLDDAIKELGYWWRLDSQFVGSGKASYNFERGGVGRLTLNTETIPFLDKNGEVKVEVRVVDVREHIYNPDFSPREWDKNLKEGISGNMTVEEIAKKHKVPVEDIRKQLEIGVKVEKEHTDDESKAERIALDHLFEIPNYYDKLDKMEKSALKESVSRKKPYDTLTWKEKELAEYLFDEYKEYYGRHNDFLRVDLPDFNSLREEIHEYYSEDISSTEIKRVIKALTSGVEEIEIYDGEIQLDDSPVMNYIQPNIPKDKYEEFDEIYWIEVDNWLEKFEKENGIEISYVGRGGRHIITPMNAENYINFDYLKDKYGELQSDFIDYINNINLGESLKEDTEMDLLKKRANILRNKDRAVNDYYKHNEAPYKTKRFDKIQKADNELDSVENELRKTAKYTDKDFDLLNNRNKFLPIEEFLKEDTIKQNGKWVNKGKEGTHGTFKTKKAADAQRKAMFANGFKESLFTKEECEEKYVQRVDYYSRRYAVKAYNKLKELGVPVKPMSWGNDGTLMFDKQSPEQTAQILDTDGIAHWWTMNRKAVIDKKPSESKELKEELGAYSGEPFCGELSDGLERGFWSDETENGTPWELTVNGYSEEEFDEEIADFLAREIAYPVRDGHLEYIGLDIFLSKYAFAGGNPDADDLEQYIPSLISLGADRKEIDAWIKDDEDAELELYIDYDIAFDIDEWEENENSSEDANLPTEITIDAETMDDLGIIPGETDGDEISDIISDYLSDTYGFCHFGFDFDEEGDHINVYGIEWDLSENLKESLKESKDNLTIDEKYWPNEVKNLNKEQFIETLVKDYNFPQETAEKLASQLDDKQIYVGIEDHQGGDFGVGRQENELDWVITALEWGDVDEMFAEYTDEDFLNVFKHGELIDWIQEMWDITIVPKEEVSEEDWEYINNLNRSWYGESLNESKSIKSYSYSVNGNGDLDIFIIDENNEEKILATISDCANKNEDELNKLAQEVIEENGYIVEKLIQGKSEETVRKNTETEIKAGKDPKQAYAIAKSIQKKNESYEIDDFIVEEEIWIKDTNGNIIDKLNEKEDFLFFHQFDNQEIIDELIDRYGEEIIVEKIHLNEDNLPEESETIYDFDEDSTPVAALDWSELDKQDGLDDEFDDRRDIVKIGKQTWVNTEEDEKVWNSLSDDDKYFLSMSNDMGFWFDEIQGNEELEDRYYELSSRFSNQKREEENLDDLHSFVEEE